MNMHTVQATWNKRKSNTMFVPICKISFIPRNNMNDENISTIIKQIHRMGKGMGYWCSK